MNTLSLSPAQELRLAALLEDLRFDTIPKETFDKNAVEAAIERIYVQAGLKLPYIIWCGGPFQLAVMPLMLQLAAFQPDADRRRMIRRRYGACSSVVAIDELRKCFQLPRWEACFSRLYEQLTPEMIENLATTATTNSVTTAKSVPPQWWRLGAPVSDKIASSMLSSCDALRKKDLTISIGLQQAIQAQYRLHRNANQTAQQWLLRTLQTEHSIFTHYGELMENPMRSSHPSWGESGALAWEFTDQIKNTVFSGIVSCFEPARPKNWTNLSHSRKATLMSLFDGAFETVWAAWSRSSSLDLYVFAEIFPHAYDQSFKPAIADMKTFLRGAFAYIPLARVIFACENPLTISVDEERRFHRTDGPAIEFRDEVRSYALQGIQIPPHYIEHPSTLNALAIENLTNIELRRVLIDHYGIDRYLHDSGCTIIEQASLGTLYEKRQSGDESIVLVQVKNSTAEPDGTFRDYFLRVPPSIRTVQEAVAWTFDMQPKQYGPKVET